MAASSALAKQRRALTKLWLKWRLPLGVLLLLVALATGGFYGFEAWRDASRAAERETLEADAREASSRFNGQVRGALDEIRALLDRDRAAALLAAGDEAGLRELLDGIAAARDDVVGARLVAADAAEVDYESVPPLSYATLDLLRRSRAAGEEQRAEVHFFGEEREHIALLLPIPADIPEPAAYVLIAASMDIVREAARAAAPPPGASLAVQQNVPGARAVSLVQLGAPRADEPALTVRVPGTIWRLRYWNVAVDTVESEESLPLPLLATAAAAVVLLFAGALLLWRRRAAESGAAGGFTAEHQVEEVLSEKLAALSSSPAAGHAPPPGMEVHEDDDGGPGGAAAGGDRELPASIFRAYDIRGIVGETLSADIVRALGRAIGSEAYDQAQQTVVVGYDGRTHSPELCAALIEGLRASGRDVIDIGRVPTPVLYFATHHLETGTGVMVTGSHNPAEYNGLKIMLGGVTLADERIAALRERVHAGELLSGDGTLQQMDVTGDYIRRVTEDIPVALGSAYKIVVDCGNGVSGDVVPKLLRGLGHDVIELHCEIDGRFPNHEPDPSQPDNLADLIRAVKKNEADLGFAFDGDGDRLGVVDGSGQVLWPDRQMMLFARDVLAHSPGATIVYDVKCSSRLGKVIEKLGGRPVMTKTGHSFMKAKMRETKAMLAGEMSGHVCFADRWYGFDDAPYAAARMVEILMSVGHPPAQVFAKLPTGIATPELLIDLDEGEPVRFMEQLLQGDRFPGAEVTTIDGLRADYPDCWGLVRASNTTPRLTLRFEADNKEALERIQGEFRQALLEVDAGLALPF